MSPAPGSGLEDQLLGQVVAEERPDLEEAKNQLIVSNAKMHQELKDIEDQILYRLSSSEGNPVDDMELIKVLEASKMKAAEIQVHNCPRTPARLSPPAPGLPTSPPSSAYLTSSLLLHPQAKVRIAEQTEKDIDLTRMEYVPVAVRTQILFFCVSDLANVDPMYQYSLEWFLNIFLSGIANSERAGNPGTDAHVDPNNQAPPWHRGDTPGCISTAGTHVDAHPGSLVHTFIRLTLHMNTYPTRGLLGANAPRGCAPDCSFGCWGDWLGWAVPQGSFFSASHPVPTLPSPSALQTT